MIHHTDALALLETLEDNSIDLVLTDPPYFIGFDGGVGWDSQWKSEEEYLAWCDAWSRECVRVLKDHRMMIVWGTLKTDTFLKYKLMLSEYPEMVSQNEIIWSYNWGGRTKKNFARKHEYAWVYSKGEEFLFNGDDVRVERKLKNSYRGGKAYTNGTIPTCVWEKNNHTMSKDFVGWHPTTKNVELLQRMILAYTNPGDTVLDIFMGSGSTAVAAVTTGRQYLGAEQHEEYVEKARERVQKFTETSEA